jgi:putative hydrolase of the HAD superfamily
VVRTRAITFDVGGTLIEPWPSVGHIYAEVAAKHGIAGASARVLNRHFAAAWRAQKSFDYTREGWRGVVEATFRKLTKAQSRSLFPDLYLRFAQPAAWRIFDDVLPTLRELRTQGVKLGIISNWDERLRPLLKSLNLDRFFAAIVVSCEVRACKPLPQIFERALKELKLPEGEVLHVGDSFRLDVRGARNAGMRALLLRREEPTRRGRISSLAELVHGPSRT